MTEREFWLMVRSALLMIVDAIERKFCLGKHKGDIVIPPEHNIIDGV